MRWDKLKNRTIKNKYKLIFNYINSAIRVKSFYRVNVRDSLTKTKEEIILANKVVVVTWRKGADWLKDMCVEHIFGYLKIKFKLKWYTMKYKIKLRGREYMKKAIGI